MNRICIILMNPRAHTPYAGKINKSSPGFCFLWMVAAYQMNKSLWWEISPKRNNSTHNGFLNTRMHSFRHSLYCCIVEIKSFRLNCFTTLKSLPTHWHTLHTPPSYPPTLPGTEHHTACTQCIQSMCISTEAGQGAENRLKPSFSRADLETHKGIVLQSF